MLNFPFWMARLPSGLLPLAFSSQEKLAEYLSDQQDFQVHLVNRYSAPAYLTELKNYGHLTISTDRTELQIKEILDELTAR